MKTIPASYLTEGRVDLDKIPKSVLLEIAGEMDKELNRRFREDPAMSQSFGEKLRKAIEDSEFNISEVARNAKVSRAALYNYMSGKQAPTIPVVRKIANVLHLDSHELLE